MKPTFIRCLPILVSLILLFSCKDDDLPAGPRFRLKKEVQQFGYNVSRGRLQTTTYSYNGRGDVASFTMVTQDNYYSQLDTVRGVLTYDAHHRLIKCTTKRTHVGSYIYYEVAQTDFSYDTKGDMTLMKAYGAQVAVGKQPPSPLLGSKYVYLQL